MHKHRDPLRFLVKLFALIALVFFAEATYAQKRVKLQQANQAKAGRLNGDRYERLIGDVIFMQSSTTIYCDSAHFFKRQNSLTAFGRVRITEGDSVTITGRRLEYDGDGKTAKLRTNVVFTKLATATLYTDNLDYQRSTNIAYYFNGGRLVDTTNVLTSNKGYYNVNSNIAIFKKDVKVDNKDYTMYTDSLRYNSRTKQIYIVVPTTVVSKNDSTSFTAESGVYNTVTRQSDLQSGVVQSKEYTIEGNKYDLDAIRNIAKIRGDVVLTYQKENVKIFGESADHSDAKGISKIYNKAYVMKPTDNDTLFISADTLVSVDDPDPKKRRLLAYKNVRIFKKDLQGVADSLEYRSADSTIYFYGKPVLWSQGNQLTADSIRMLIQRNTIHKIYLVSNSFVISEDTLKQFNQIKGRRMTADLTEGRISRVFVQGNGESLYFALDDKTATLMGMNKIICSNIIIRFKEGKVNNLSFLVTPEAKFIPPHELKTDDQKLKGFNWNPASKPSRESVVPLK